ncbi:HIT family protein [Enterococcus sp.]|uniref:HIT family protein n=1 Tax=Enterococcus sp. TaxID=35783 RepID=UPI002FC83B2C
MRYYRKKISSKIIFENNKTIAFLSNKNDVSGHILIVPKIHFSNLDDINEEEFFEVQKTLLKINNHVVKNCQYTGTNILMASGKSAGQSINHIHFHLIPRKENDNINAWPRLSDKKEGTSEELYKKLKIN